MAIWIEALVDAMREGGYSEASLAAGRDDQGIGHILFSRVHVHTSNATIEALSLAPQASCRFNNVWESVCNSCKR